MGKNLVHPASFGYEYRFQVFVTQQDGKRPGQIASYGCEYSF
jgi:hypothetical protein